MGKITDISVPLDFMTQPSHVIEYDPTADTRQIDGRDGKKFYVIAVKENGRPYDLSLSNKTLLGELTKYSAPTKLKITRTGESFSTKYAVEKVA